MLIQREELIRRVESVKQSSISPWI